MQTLAHSPNSLTSLANENVDYCSLHAGVPTSMYSRSIVVLGAAMSGKTSLCTRLVHDRFEDSYEPTVQNTFIYLTKNSDFVTSAKSGIFMNCNIVELIIRDTQGLSEQEPVGSEYGIGYHAYLLVFSISSRRSFDIIKCVYAKLLMLMGFKPPMVLVGTKADLQDARHVSRQDAEALAKAWGIRYIECSAKFNSNVEKPFLTVLQEVERSSSENTRSTFFRLSGLRSVISNAIALNIDEYNLPIWESTAQVSLTLAILISSIALLSSLAILFKLPGTEGELLSYTCFSFGSMSFAICMVGMYGMYEKSLEYLCMFIVSKTLLLLAEIFVFLWVISNLDVVKHSQTNCFEVIGIVIFVHLFAITIIYVYQNLLSQLQTSEIEEPILSYKTFE